MSSTNLESFQFRFPKPNLPKLPKLGKRGNLLKLPKLGKGGKLGLLIIVIYFLFSIVRFKPDSETVGFFCGECIGYRYGTYQINDENIAVDTIAGTNRVQSLHKTISGDFKNLKFSVPLLLLFHFTGDIGYPDSHDQGGYILGFKLLGIPFSYNIDKGSEPWYFTDMTDLIIDRSRSINTIITNSNKNP